MGAWAERAAASGGLPEAALGVAAPGLAASLLIAARLHPQRTAFRDAGERPLWCGRPAITWTYAAAAEIVGRLARGIGAWRLPPGSRIGLWFGGGAEAALAHLAVEAAGHLPCAIPAVWDGDRLSKGIDAVGIVALLCDGRRGERRPAGEAAEAAIRHFGLRYLAAFGPGLPDGVISLDAMALERGVADPRPSRGVVTFACGDPGRPVHRSAAGLDAAIAAHLGACPVADGARILTLLPAHDLRGLVTGLGSALSAGVTLETLVPFSQAGLLTALARPAPTRLVVPAAVEAAIAAMPMPWTVRTLNVVARAPARLPRPSVVDPRRNLIDSLVLDEDAVLTLPRGSGGLDQALRGTADPAWPPRLLELARGAGGRILHRGPACTRAELSRSGGPGSADRDWQPSPYHIAVEPDGVAVVTAG